MTRADELAAQVEATMAVTVHLRDSFGSDMLCGRSSKLVKANKRIETWTFVRSKPAPGLLMCAACWTVWDQRERLAGR